MLGLSVVPFLSVAMPDCGLAGGWPRLSHPLGEQALEPFTWSPAAGAKLRGTRR
jgi:hypothetical protein